MTPFPNSRSPPQINCVWTQFHRWHRLGRFTRCRQLAHGRWDVRLGCNLGNQLLDLPFGLVLRPSQEVIAIRLGENRRQLRRRPYRVTVASLRSGETHPETRSERLMREATRTTRPGLGRTAGARHSRYRPDDSGRPPIGSSRCAKENMSVVDTALPPRSYLDGPRASSSRIRAPRRIPPMA